MRNRPGFRIYQGLGSLTSALCLCLASTSLVAQDTSSAVPQAPAEIDEVVIAGQETEIDVHLGWEPDSAEQVDELIGRTYQRVKGMSALAEACDIDSIDFIQTYAKKKPCEDFLEYHRENFVDYRNNCYVLLQWYQHFSAELQGTPNVEEEYRGTLLWMAQTRENLEITCDMQRVRDEMPYLDIALDQIARIGVYVTAPPETLDSWGSPRLLPRGLTPAEE